jgi:hypothetical protein
VALMRAIFAVFVGIAAVGACTPAGEPAASVDVSDSAGVTIVDSDEPSWGEGEAWLVSSEPQVTIGVLKGRREYELSDVSAAARQSDGDFVVVDGGAREVRLYDRDGKFVRTLGGPGSGPGEFRDPAQVLVRAADSVIVWDNANYRITRFDSAGELVGVESVDRGGIAKAIDPPLYPGKGELLADGQILIRLVEKTRDFPPGLFRPRSGALRVFADLSRIDTLMFFGDVEQIYVRAPWGQMPVVPALARRTSSTVQATLSRACIGDQEGPEIVCFGPDAARTVIRWPSEAAPATEQDIAAWRDTVLAQATVPTVRPHYSWIALDRVGNLWVQRGRANGSAAESVDHLVFDPTGALLGVVALPPIEVLEIGDDYVMGVYRDELDVEYLQVHEIVKQPAGTLDP